MKRESRYQCMTCLMLNDERQDKCPICKGTEFHDYGQSKSDMKNTIYEKYPCKICGKEFIGDEIINCHDHLECDDCFSKNKDNFKS